MNREGYKYTWKKQKVVRKKRTQQNFQNPSVFFQSLKKGNQIHTKQQKIPLPFIPWSLLLARKWTQHRHDTYNKMTRLVNVCQGIKLKTTIILCAVRVKQTSQILQEESQKVMRIIASPNNNLTQIIYFPPKAPINALSLAKYQDLLFFK